jgi:hypothetical protein
VCPPAPPTAWREDVLTRAKELDSLRARLLDTVTADPDDPWWAAILLNHVQRHLEPDDPRRRELERLAGRLGPDHTLAGTSELSAITDEGATPSSAASVRPARPLCASSSGCKLPQRPAGHLGGDDPDRGRGGHPGVHQPRDRAPLLPAREVGPYGGRLPHQQSALLDTGQESGPATPDVDDVVKGTAGPADLLVVELIGLTAAAVAAATALRGIRGSSEPYGLRWPSPPSSSPWAPSPPSSACSSCEANSSPAAAPLDTSAQILAWALVFGYAQQLFTRLVDQQAHCVLNTVRERKPGR